MRRFVFLVCAFAALFSALAHADEEPIRLTYSAPAACPNESAFLASVRARTQHGKFAEPGELARTFDVAISDANSERAPQDPVRGGFVGRLSFIDADGQLTRREVTGEGCEEVASSLSLIAALAIDERVAELEVSEPAPLPPPATLPPREPPKEAKPSAPASVRGAAPPRLRADRGVSWLLGANAGVLSWVSPRVSIELGAFIELSQRKGASSLRLSVFDARQSQAVQDSRAHFATDWARLELCQVLFRARAGASISPCLAFDAGALRASVDSSAALTNATSRSIFWAAGLAVLRLRWQVVSRLELGLDGELGVPFVRHTFELQNPSVVLFRPPSAGLGSQFSAALRFP